MGATKDPQAGEEELEAVTPQLFGIVPIIDALRDTAALEKSFEDFEAGRRGRAFEGFRTVLGLIFRFYPMWFERDDYLPLETGLWAFRASWTDVDPAKIPPRSERARAIRTVHDAFERVRETLGKDGFEDAVEHLDDVLGQPLRRVLRESVTLAPEHAEAASKEDIVRAMGMDTLVRACHDDHRLTPDTGLEELYDEEMKKRLEKEKDRWEHLHEGHALGLSYLWSHIAPGGVGELLDALSSVEEHEDFHEADKLARKVYRNYLEETLGLDLLEDDPLLGSPPEKRPIVEAMAKEWPEPTPEGPNADISEIEFVNQELYWYQAEVIDSARYRSFAGARLFVPLLEGEAALRRRVAPEEPVEVVQFIHEEKEPTWFTYGVLLTEYGAIADGSGWVLFEEVAGDYVGRGGQHHDEIEELLQRHEEILNVRRVEVSLGWLQDYLQEQARKSVERRDTTTPSEERRYIEQEARSRLGHARGFLLELLAAEALRRREGTEVYTSFQESEVLPPEWEIDVLVHDPEESRVIVVECQTQLSADDPVSQADEIEAKVRHVRDSDRWQGASEVEGWLVTLGSKLRSPHHRRKIKDALEAAGARLKTFEEDVHPELPSTIRKKRASHLDDIFSPLVGRPPRPMESVDDALRLDSEELSNPEEDKNEDRDPQDL